MSQLEEVMSERLQLLCKKHSTGLPEDEENMLVFWNNEVKRLMPIVTPEMKAALAEMEASADKRRSRRNRPNVGAERRP
jgi:hypothetical protein